MRKIILMLSLAIFFSLSVIAQRGSLSGMVKDNKGLALPGATIYVHDIKTGTVADSLGHYKIPSLPFGQYLVEVHHIGYGSVTEAIIVNAATVRDFILAETVVEQEGVIITGVATATKLKQSPQPVSLVRRTDLVRTAATNIIDALTREPGVTSLSTGPAIAKPVIRGLGYNRMVVINDGIRQEGQQWGDEHGIEIDEYSVQRAEILKGPASLMYGSDAMAGVINIVTNQPVERGTIKGNVLTHFQHNNSQLGINANLAGHSNNGFNWNVYGSHKSAGDYRNKYDGRVMNSRFNELNFGGYAGVNKQWGYSHLLFSRFNQQAGLVEGERDSATGAFLIFPESPLERIALDKDLRSKELTTPYQRIIHTKVASDNSFRLPKGRLNVLVGYQRNERKEFADPTIPGEPELYFDLQTVNYNIQYHSPAGKNKWATSVGINGMYQQNFNRAEEVLIPAYQQLDAGAFVYTRKTFEKFTLSGGLRLDTRQLNVDELEEGGDIKFEGYKKQFANVSGSIGISYDVNDHLTLKSNIARGFRAPNIAELSSNGAHEGTNRYEYGQRDLRSETSLQFDLGATLNTEHFSLSANVFYNNIQDYIFYRKLNAVGGGDSLVMKDGEELTAFRFDQSAASLYGGELNFDIHPHPLDWLHFENTFSYVRGRFHSAIDGSQNLPFIPAARLNSEVRTDFRKAGKHFSNLYLRLELEQVFRQGDVFSGYDTETATDGFSLLHFGAGADIQSGQRTLFTLHLAVNNLADVGYQQHLSRLKYAAVNNVTGRMGVFNMGRNISVKVNVPLNF